MATLRVYEDQENNAAHSRRVHKDTQTNGQQKRSVLATLNTNVTRPNQQNVLKEGVHAQKNEAFKKTTFDIFNDEPPGEDFKDDMSVASSSAKSEIEESRRVPLQSITENKTPQFTEGSRSSPMLITGSGSRKPLEELHEKDVFSGFCNYHEEIYNYLLVAEKRHIVKPNYMARQPDITASMRAILVDWLVEVVEEYKLHTETLYLAVSYIDRFLSYMSVVRAKLQLVGTAAMFIAAKYEEIYPPNVKEFVYITDETYTIKQVLRMEHIIMKVLGFDISIPSVLSFILAYTESLLVETDKEKIPQPTKDSVLYLAMYMSELSLLEGDPYLQYSHSIRAAAAVALSRYILKVKPVWPAWLESIVGYSFSDIQQCGRYLLDSFKAAPDCPQQAVREKYKSNTWNNVALLPVPSEPFC